MLTICGVVYVGLRLSGVDGGLCGLLIFVKCLLLLWLFVC